MKKVIICISLTILAMMSLGCEQATAPSNSDPSSTSAPASGIDTVDLLIDFGEEREAIEVVIPCSVGSTVFSTLKRAEHQGDLQLEAAGSGETAFVKGINGLMGDANTDRYWFFYVDGQLAKQGCGVVEVDPGRKIEWRYQKRPANFDQ